MAKIGFILQAVSVHDHAAELKKLLSLPAPDRILLSIAYARETVRIAWITSTSRSVESIGISAPLM